MTDAEQLVTLRAWPGWPWKTLDPLAGGGRDDGVTP